MSGIAIELGSCQPAQVNCVKIPPASGQIWPVAFDA